MALIRIMVETVRTKNDWLPSIPPSFTLEAKNVRC
jgi:hypothetical protein